MEWQLVWRGEDWSLEREVDQCVAPSWCSSCALVLFYRVPLTLNMSALVSKTQWNAYTSEMRIRNELTDLLFFSCICLVVFCNQVHCNLLCVYWVICCCSWILPAIKNKAFRICFRLWGRNGGSNCRHSAKADSIHTPGLQETPLSRTWLHWMNLMGGINWIQLLSLRMLLLVFTVGGIVKGERKRKEKKDRDLKNSDQVLVCRSRIKTENLFSGRSRIFLNCLLFTIQKFTHCFLCLVSCLPLLWLCYSSFVYYKVLNKYKNCKIRMESVTLIFNFSLFLLCLFFVLFVSYSIVHMELIDYCVLRGLKEEKKNMNNFFSH